MTDRADASLSRVTTARLVTASAVLGGALALAGLGAFTQPHTPAGNVGPGISTVEFTQPISHG